MLREGRFRPVQLIALTAVGLTMAACEKAQQNLEPPRVVQLACKLPQAGASMVFIIDTGRERVEWANAPARAVGTVETTDRQYRLHFSRTAQTYEWMSIINRYDGAMQREVGNPPFLRADGAVGSGNISQTWTCALQKTGPRL